MHKEERGIGELYSEDPERADELLWGRKTGPSRRGFLRGAGLASMGAALGATIPFHANMPAGLIPAAFAQGIDFQLEGKDSGLTVLNDRPVNIETPPHLLDDDVTPASRHFVRNNGSLPDPMPLSDWRLTIDGEVETPMELSYEDLMNDFEQVTLRLQIECGGNGRAAYDPPARGNQWTTGAIANSEWTGVRLRDILHAAGLKQSGTHTGHFGYDEHLSGNPDLDPISRGGPINKMMDPHTIVALKMNGEDIPAAHGNPCRVIAPGWPGSVSQKWLTRIWVRSQVHDGAKMTGQSYRVPRYPVAPGTDVPDEDMMFIESMPVKSLVTFPEAGTEVAAGMPFEVRGQAWAGDNEVAAVDVSFDFGATWQRADLSPPPNRYSWQRWRANLRLPMAGYYEIWARATDDEGVSQPMVVPGWNPRGYLNNQCHRIHVMAV